MTATRRGEIVDGQTSEETDRQLGSITDDLPHIVWTARPDGELDYVNKGWVAYTGLTLDTMQGSGWETVVHPADRQVCLRQWHQAREAGVPYEITCRLKRVDGVYRWHLGRVQPRTDASGCMTAWLGTYTDIDTLKRAEESQRTSILETALDAIITMDADGCIVDFNPAAVRIFGYQRDAAVGQKLADLIVPPQLRDAHRAGLTTYLATGEERVIGQRIEITAMRADGTLFPVELAITRVPLGGPPLFTGYLRDISDRVRAAEERSALLAQVVERATQLDATFDAITDAVVVFDSQGRITQANNAIRTLFGLDIHTAVGSDLSDQPVMLYTPLDADGQPLPREAWPRFRILQGEVLTGAHAVDTHGIVHDKRLVHLNVTGAPLRDAAGTIIGGVMVMRDVTERRRLEQRTHAALDALLAMAEVLIEGAEPTPLGDEREREPHARRVAQRLVDLIRDVLGCRRVSISTLDAASGLLHPLAITGLNQEEERLWKERPATSRLDAADPALVARLLAGEVVALAMDTPPYRDRPNPFGARVILTALLRIGSQAVGVLALDHGGEHHDYTPDERALTAAVAKLAAVVIERDRLLRERAEARASEEALREANRRMDEFLGIAGHEMRTPLTTIKGNLQLAQRRLGRVLQQVSLPNPPDGLDDVQQLLDRADAQLRRLDRLVDDVLDVSRIRAGYLEIRPTPCDLKAIVRDVVNEQRQRAGPRAILVVGVTDDPLTIDADADRIGQVLTNYLTNALKYSDARRPVTVGLDVSRDEARVWVRDEGPGIAQGDQERIWERFYRVTSTEHRHGSSVGLGMGLHISRTIIVQHGGQVGVESVVGAGATFWFSLPLYVDVA